jgi:hypothetical protein
MKKYAIAAPTIPWVINKKYVIGIFKVAAKKDKIAKYPFLFEKNI